MEKTSRTFLLGAGFSKAVANGPVMTEIWSRMKERYEQEKNRRTSVDNLRIQWFEDLDSKLNKLESLLTNRFKRYDNIRVQLRENVEYIFTLIDLSLSAPQIEKNGSPVSYPAIPIPFSKSELEGMKTHLQTFLYLILVNLKGSHLANKFASIIKPSDEIITFNYDLVLEKALFSAGIWFPLGGYVGVSEFEQDEDKKCLEKRNKYSKLRIHKMHGSINLRRLDKLERLRKDHDIVIVMDNLETQGFHFDGLLDRKPVKVKQGYVGGHEPGWMLPSFIKLFERKEFYEIWQSTIKVMSETEELVIIGYSFRPEDSSSFLLLSTLPQKCNIALVDRCPERIKERLENKRFKISRIFISLEDYLSEK